MPIFSNTDSKKKYSSLILSSGVNLKNYVSNITSMKGSIIGIECDELRGIQYPINHSGYVLPQTNGITWIGSSYEQENKSLSTKEIQEHILSKAIEVFKNIKVNTQILEWSGIRSTLPDRMPLAGEIDNNVFMIGGLASRGLSFAPLLAEIVSNEISGLASPVSKKVLESLSPSRFTKNST
jgi:glycine/D-amino acid oxidase-like deaminating enzyme